MQGFSLEGAQKMGENGQKNGGKTQAVGCLASRGRNYAQASIVSRALDHSRMRVRSSEPTFCPGFRVRPGNGF